MVTYKDGKRVVVTDHAALQYAKRYEPSLSLDAARQRVADHFYRSDARMLNDLSPQGDQQWLLPELDCVVVFKPDAREEHEGDWVIPTVLPNPARKINMKPLAGLAKVRDLFPSGPPALPPTPDEGVPEPWEEPQGDAPAGDAAGPDRELLLALEARLRGRAAAMRAAVAEAPGSPNLGAWADRQMTVAAELASVADELGAILRRERDRA